MLSITLDAFDYYGCFRMYTEQNCASPASGRAEKCGRALASLVLNFYSDFTYDCLQSVSSKLIRVVGRGHVADWVQLRRMAPTPPPSERSLSCYIVGLVLKRTISNFWSFEIFIPMDISWDLLTFGAKSSGRKIHSKGLFLGECPKKFLVLNCTIFEWVRSLKSNIDITTLQIVNKNIALQSHSPPLLFELSWCFMRHTV